ncbi:hypothetical protein CYMTET_20693 [Cymbomonas tetramitiformis]|uniref:Uncharacterized protein n=1 Tax=Cymbomonas tetramitiformis TaxID=36881 RepID=A0AAE0L3Y6_9CHLO|nr:hypothetical protein CYMTET_20693 [Cymbomonas tetramitiformis]
MLRQRSKNFNYFIEELIQDLAEAKYVLRLRAAHSIVGDNCELIVWCTAIFHQVVDAFNYATILPAFFLSIVGGINGAVHHSHGIGQASDGLMHASGGYHIA